MKFFYGVLGFVAQQSDKMSRQSVNMIPFNWLCIVAGPLLGAAFVFGSNDTAHLFWAVPLAVVACVFAALLLVSWFLRNVIFQKQTSVGAPGNSIGGAPGAPFEGALIYTGKLRLQEKVARRFLAVPARLVTLENGARAFASNIDASSRMYGVVTKARTGTWLSIPRAGTLQVEDGQFYHGFAGRPALRLRYVDEMDGSKASAIVAFDSAQQREAARGALGARAADSGGLNPAFSS